MLSGELFVGGLLSALWVAGAVQDVRTQKVSNLLTFTAVALTLGFRAGQGLTWEYLAFMIGGWAVAWLIWQMGLYGGGDAKMVMGLLAWQPGLEAWTLAAFSVAVVGLIVVAWRFINRKQRPAHYPLAGAVTLAGLALVWAV